MIASKASPYPVASSLSDGGDLGYGQLFSVLLRRKLWVLAPLVISLGLAAIYTSRQDPTYASSMQLLVESNYQSKKLSDGGDFVDPNVAVDNATQLSLMRSSELMRRAMASLQDQYPELDPDDPGAVNQFRREVQLIQVADGKKNIATKIYQVVYTSNDPRKSEVVLKALKQVYLDYNLEQQQLRLTRGLSFINEQLPEVKAQVEASESALQQFRQGQGVIDPEQQAQAQMQMLNTLDQELRANVVQLNEFQRRYGSLTQQVGMPPEQARLASRLSQSSRYQSLLNQVQQTELALIEQRLLYQDITPQVDLLQKQRQQQLQLLAAELSRALNVNYQGANAEALLYQGQLGASEIDLINQLVTARLNLDTARARQETLQQTRRVVEAELARFPTLLAEYGRLLPEIQSSRETLQLLLKSQQELGLEIARGGFDWQVVEEPLLGFAGPVDWQKNLLLGGVAGLMVGGMAAFAREALDDMVHTSEELQKQVPVPLVGMLPALHISGSEFGRKSREAFGGQEALAPAMKSLLRWPEFREAMDLVYQNIQLLNSSSAFKSVVVTSALAGEGKSTVSLGLAFSAARLHGRVLLIDADLRRPSLHKLMDLPNDEGLSTYLMEPGRLPEHLMPAGVDDGRTGVSVLTAGPLHDDPAKLLSAPRLGQLIAHFQASYDLVVVDAPPSLGMVDSMLLSAHCDGTLLVGRMDRLTKTELSQTLENLKHLNVIGVVANAVSQVRKPYAYVGSG